MAEERRNTIVGLFALLGLGVAAVLVLVFGGGQMLMTRTYNINVHFEEGVVGVQAGQGVTLHGKRVGETKSVEFWRDEETGEERPELGVNVIIAVKRNYDLPASSQVLVATSIMGFGRPAIMITVQKPDEAERLPRDGTAVISGQMVKILDQVLPVEMQSTLVGTADSLKELAGALTPVAENLARLLEARDVEKVDLLELTANMDTVIQRFDTMLRNLNALLGDEQNQTNLSELLANLRMLSDSGLVLMDNLNKMGEDGPQLMKDVSVLVGKLAEAIDGLSSFLQQAGQTLTMLNEGEGSAALFLRDNRFYEDLLLTIRRLTKAVDDMREVLDIVKQGKLRIKAF
jgi:ABC-type transporter Mla subunit MlaD